MSNFKFDFIWGKFIKFICLVIYILIVIFCIQKANTNGSELIFIRQRNSISISSIRECVWSNCNRIDELLNSGQEWYTNFAIWNLYENSEIFIF